MNKNMARNRRGLKAKAIIRNGSRPRLVVYRSNMHVYAQIVIPGDKGDCVIATSSTLDKELKPVLTGSKRERAKQVGELLAKRANAKSIVNVAFDRNGYPYCGCVRALADGARDAGLEF